MVDVWCIPSGDDTQQITGRDYKYYNDILVYANISLKTLLLKMV